MCPVYLSSRVCTLMPFVEAVDRLEYAMEADGGGNAKSERYDFEERAGRLSARAALWRSGDVVEEKLYGTELLSIGCTWDVNILTFSSAKVTFQRVYGIRRNKLTWKKGYCGPSNHTIHRQ